LKSDEGGREPTSYTSAKEGEWVNNAKGRKTAVVAYADVEKKKERLPSAKIETLRSRGNYTERDHEANGKSLPEN